MYLTTCIFSFFFFNDTATTEIYTLSLHDALPIWFAPRDSRCAGRSSLPDSSQASISTRQRGRRTFCSLRDRKSTRLNSSHDQISYAVFCLKKKKTKKATEKNLINPERATRADVLR